MTEQPQTQNLDQLTWDELWQEARKAWASRNPRRLNLINIERRRRVMSKHYGDHWHGEL